MANQSVLGKIFKTGNFTVNQLPVGTVLGVAGKGELEVLELPFEASYEPGDAYDSKYGPAVVVDLSSRFGKLAGFDPATQFLYVAEGSNKVRVATR